jgi:hypothetical protein
VKEFEDGIDDEVLAALDNDNNDTIDFLDEPEMEYVDADDDTDVATVATSLEDALAPIDMDIPELVDHTALEQIAGELDTAAVTNTISLPTVQPLGLDTFDIDMGGDAALRECNDMSNVIGQAAGIDTNTLSVDLLAQNDANGIRNVRLRQAQGQQASSVGPAFNEEMKDKWIELWSSGTNPSDGRISFRDWYQKMNKEYKIWMFKRLLEAEEQDITPRPQLFKVDYEATEKWVREMKAVANSAMRTGAFNSASALLGQQFESVLGTTTNVDNVAPFSDAGGIGVAIHHSTLQLSVSSTARENIFQPPTAAAVREIMPTNAKKRARKANEIDTVLLERQAKAKRVMELHDISPDSKDSSRRRCTACDKYYAFEFGGAKHLKKGVQHCPLADDVSDYNKHVEAQERELKERTKIKNNKYQQKKRQEQLESEVNSAP